MPLKAINLITSIPKLFKAGFNMFTKFKTLSMKGKLITATVVPVSVWGVAALIEHYGYDNVMKAIETLGLITSTIPVN